MSQTIVHQPWTYNDLTSVTSRIFQMAFFAVNNLLRVSNRAIYSIPIFISLAMSRDSWYQLIPLFVILALCYYQFQVSTIAPLSLCSFA